MLAASASALIGFGERYFWWWRSPSLVWGRRSGWRSIRARARRAHRRVSARFALW